MGHDLKSLYSTSLREVQARRCTMGQDLETWRFCRALLYEGRRFGGVPPPAGCTFPSIAIGPVGMAIPHSWVAIRAPHHGARARWAVHVHQGFAAFSTRFLSWTAGGVSLSLGPSFARSSPRPGAPLDRGPYSATRSPRPRAHLDREPYSARSLALGSL